jgi:PIN domain nuclease of toxin-antitoxin system
MLNLDTHMLIYLLDGTLNPREQQLVVQSSLAISDIVLWELAKLVQLGRITLDLGSPAFQTCLQQLTIITHQPGHRPRQHTTGLPLRSR